MEWLSVYKGGIGEIEEKKSRFIATVRPVSSEEEAVSFIASVKKQYWDARHNCSAFVIGDSGQKTRCSDDGEPSGTAGRPMLDVLTNEHITNVCVVVTRYFGGTLLGTGGLVRAYSSAVKAALENCEIIRKVNGHSIKIECDYNDLGRIKSMLDRNGTRMKDVDYGSRVTAMIITEDADTITRDITDISSGRVQITDIKPIVFATVEGEIMIF
ncbi:MAG: YigZ family protein [Lachnospiraceae bacterium]|nr:YigZ family protein [Lachnospiraceae bacterium]